MLGLFNEKDFESKGRKRKKEKNIYVHMFVICKPIVCW